MISELTVLQWTLAIVASLLIGLSKTGISGLGMLSVAIYAVVFPSRASVGLVLPLLICGDIFAIAAYRSHAQWNHLKRLFPWAATGIISGFLVMHYIDNRQTQVLIGVLLLLMVALNYIRRSRKASTSGESGSGTKSYWYAAFIGVFAGFSTMTANAAGPLMVLYLLMMGFPKLQFMGTSAWFFFVINLFKVPFAFNLGLFTPGSLSINALMIPFVIIGAIAGRWILYRINQSLFERITVVLTILAAIKMLLPS